MTVIFAGVEYPSPGELGKCGECSEQGHFRWHSGIPSGYRCDKHWAALLGAYAADDQSCCNCVPSNQPLRIVVVVNGGCVTSVTCSDGNYEYRVVDYDSIKAGQAGPDDLEPDPDAVLALAMEWLKGDL